MLITLMAMYFMMSSFFGSAAYYIQYVMGDISCYSSISNALSLAQIITMFCTPFLMIKVSKRNTIIIGAMIQVLGFAGTGLAGDHLAVQIMMSAVKGIGFGCAAAAMFGLLQDAITYGQWKNGYGTAGLGNAASSFGMKVGSGIGTAVLGAVLHMGKFDPALEAQGNAAQNAITFSFAWIPAITAVIIILCMVFFDIDKIYDKVTEDLANGRYKVCQ